MKYQCPRCDTIYNEKTEHGLCPDDRCLGEELVEYTEESVERAAREELPVSVIEGLCLLVCDISYSMNEPAFADSEVIKLKMVTRAIQRALVELYPVSKAEEAYIGIIAFGARAALVSDQQKRPFLLPVAEIQREFGGDTLNPYLLECFDTDAPHVDRRYTDIASGLTLSREIYDAAVSGNLTAYGVGEEVSILKHKDIYTRERKQIPTPNVRVLLYSDGVHNPENRAPLFNPFESLYPSPLMTAFIGDASISEETRRGANQLLELANTCVMHNQKGCFVIDNAEEYATLRMLFRMASGVSGFCPECLKGYIRKLKEQESRPWMRREEDSGG